MALITLPTFSSGTAVFLALVVGTAVAACAYATRHFGYWRRKGIPYLRPIPIAGNLKDFLLFRKHIGNLLQDIYTEMKDQPYLGMFFFDQPVLFIKDISLWKSIVHKDFEYFGDRGFSPAKSQKIYSDNLFARKGHSWRVLRDKLNPAFTVGKLKRFFVLLEQKAANLDHYFDDAARDGTPRYMMKACARYTMDAIATVGFGIETTALLDDDDPLHKVLRSIFEYSKVFTIASVATFVDLPLLRLLDTSLMPSPLAHFMRSAVWRVVRERERAGLQGARGDIMDLLLELRQKGSIAGDEDAPGDDEADAPGPKDGARIDLEGDTFVAQAFSVFSAGFDTTTTTMSYALYELAKNQSMQEKLRKQLQKAVEEHDGKLTYEALYSVHYLDMIFQETLRMYPVLPYLDRTCTKDYRIPGTDVVIDKGVFAFTSILGIHRDPEIYPDPELFDPERFSDANKHNIPSGAYFPFGAGAHRCIGMRLATMLAKTGIAHIVLNYRVHPCAATPEKMEFNLNTFLIHPRDGVPLNFSRLEKDLSSS